MGDDRPARYVEGDRVIYRASQLGACPNVFSYLAQDLVPAGVPEWLQTKYDEGNTLERPIIDGFMETVKDTMNKDAMDYQATVELQVLPGIYVRGHTDGISRNVDLLPTNIVEAKAFGDDYWARWQSKGLEGFPEYKWQVTCYMLGTDLPCWFVVGHKSPDGTKIIEIESVLVTRSPYTMIQLKKRIAMLEEIIEEDVRVPCEVMYPCPFFYMHVDQEEGTRESASRIDDEILKTMITRLVNVNDDLKALETDKKALTQGIQGWFEANGLASGQVIIGDYKVTDVFVYQPARQVKAFTQHYVRVSVPRKGPPTRTV